jgi:carbamoyl-phosphate synthase large subunit
MESIAISGLNATDNPAPGLPVAKSLKDEYKIIGLSYDPNEPANYLDAISKTYLMPYPSLGFEALYNRIKEIKEKENISMIIPCLDAELPLYIKYQEQIQALGIKVVLPSQENFELRNKNKLDKLSKQLQITYPKTFEITSIDDLHKVTQNLQYPIMVKGNYYKAYMAYNFESAIEYFYKISNEWGFPILIQEVVHGEELNLVGVGDGKGNLTGAVTIKKLTTTDIGKIWTGITIEHKPMINVAKKFISQTKWKGPFELECIVNGDDVYMIEINPRFPAWVYFATGVGINLPKQLVNIANNKDVKPQLQYPSGKLYVRFTDEIITDFSEFSQLMTKKEL